MKCFSTVCLFFRVRRWGREDERRKVCNSRLQAKKDCNQVETSKTFRILLVFCCESEQSFLGKIYQKIVLAESLSESFGDEDEKFENRCD